MAKEPGILLHPEKGLNPRLTFCPRCHGDAPELILIGANDKVITCPHCGMNAIGFKSTQLCPSCKKRLAGGKTRTLDDHERLPGSLCKACEEEMKKLDEIVKAGGVFFSCKCGAEGVLRPEHPAAKAARDHFGFHNGEPCGIKADTCPQCNKDDGPTGEANPRVGDAG
jgi:hypothetical protein